MSYIIAFSLSFFLIPEHTTSPITTVSPGLPFLRVHTHAVKRDRLQHFRSHDLKRRVLWQLKIEEARVRFGHQLILRDFLVDALLDHEPHVQRFECLVVGGDSLLTPAELDKALSVGLCHLSQHQPEVLDGWVLVVVGAGVLGVALEEVNVGGMLATDPNLQLFARHDVEERAGDHFRYAALYRIILWLAFPEPRVNHCSDVMFHFCVLDLLSGPVWPKVDLGAVG